MIELGQAMVNDFCRLFELLALASHMDPTI
jgi:hypothetical protein